VCDGPSVALFVLNEPPVAGPAEVRSGGRTIDAYDVQGLDRLDTGFVMLHRAVQVYGRWLGAPILDTAYPVLPTPRGRYLQRLRK
jgi:hypothetical protein